MSTDPIVQFYRLIEATRPAKRADRGGGGYLPSRGLRYCDALTTATAYGYWVFPPMDFRLLWDGEQVFWSYGEDHSWLPLSGTDSRAVQFPNYAAAFDRLAPEPLQGCSPPFLTAFLEPGTVQMWTGLLVRTRPGWSLSVRSPVNLPTIPGVLTWDGVIETDLWFGPLFTNIRLTRTDMPVQIRSQVPIIQVQPVPQLAYREEVLGNFACSEAVDLSDDDWHRLAEVLLPNPHATIRQGEYAVAVRKRRSCPYDTSALTDAALSSRNR
jgi:Family of unknown function (DUF6065)